MDGSYRAKRLKALSTPTKRFAETREKRKRKKMKVVQLEGPASSKEPAIPLSKTREKLIWTGMKNTSKQ